MAINIVTSTSGEIYLQTGIGVPTHIAPIGSQFTDTASGKFYRNLDGQTDWQEQVSFTGASESISAFTTFHSTTSGQSDIIAEVFNDTLNFSGSNIGIYTNDVTKTMTFSASSDGSFLTNIPVSGVTNLQTNLDTLSGETISAFTFNQMTSEISITTNNGGFFPIDVTSLAQGIYITGGTYDPNTGNVEFSNSTGGTFVVSGFTTGITDTYINSGSFNDTTYEVDYLNNLSSGGFTLDLSNINDDITGTTANLQSQIDTKVDEVDFSAHTADTSIHFTKNSILLSELGDTAHTHTISEVNGLQGELDAKTDVTDFDTHTGDTSIHYTKNTILLSELGDTAHTHTIAEVNGLQTELDSKVDVTTFTAHTADTSIHYTKNSILLSELGDTAHTHTIAEVNGLGGNLMSLNDAITGNTANLISGVTFTTGTYLLSLDKNDATSFVADLSVLASDVYVLSGVYDPNTGNVEFTNSTGGTFNVSGFTTGMTDTFVDGGAFNDTTYDIDFTKNVGPGFSVNLSDINDDITGATTSLQTQIDTKADEVDFNAHTADTSIHFTKSSILLSELGDTAHTHTIAEVNGLQGELDTKTNTTDFDTHTGDTSIHFTKNSILLSELGDTAHTHTISEVNGLQTELDTINSGITGNTSNLISGVTFNENTSIITLDKNDDTSFIINLSGFSGEDVFVTGGTYNVNDGEIVFTNSTGNTFVVSGFTTGTTDTFVDGGAFNDTTYDIDFTKNVGPGFSVNLSDIQDDIISGDTKLQTRLNTHTGDTSIHYTKSSILLSELGDTAHTHTISEVSGLQGELDAKTDETTFTAHTADTSIHYTKSSINFNELGDTAHTHTIAEVSGLQTELDSKTDVTDFDTHTGDTSIHYTKSSILLSELGDTAHTHTIAEVNGLQGELDSKTDVTDFDTHTGDTSIHFTKNSILLSELGDTAHTHTIAEVSGLQTELDSKTDVTDFDTHTADTSIHYTKSSILLSELGDSAHTHTIAEVNGLQSELDSKADEVDFNTHTADTSIHYTKSSILLSELGDSAHTHTIAEVNGLQSELDALSSGSSGLTADFNAHTADTSIHYTKSSILLSELGDSAHTHTIAEVNGLQSELDSKADEVDFNTHTADTSIHYTKSSILLSELGNSGHTHPIAEVNGLQSELDALSSGSSGLTADFNAHTADTSIHYTKSSILLSELGDSAHTHTIAEVNGLQDELDALSSGSSGLTADFNAHTADTSIHYTKSSILLSELGDSAHTHTIMEIDGLGSNLMGLNDGITANTANIISGVTFDEGSSILSLNKNDDTSFIANLSALTSDVYVVSGSYNPQNEEITFTNNTGGTFIVTGVTTGTTDTFIDSGVINPTTYEVDFTKNIGLGFALDLSTIQNDIITGDTALQTQIDNHVSDGNNPHNTTFSNLVSTAHTHTISDVFGLQGELNSKLDLTGGTLTGSLSATTYFGDGSNLTGVIKNGENVGTGHGVFTGTSGTDLQFRSLVAGSNITITPSATEITIASTGGGSSRITSDVTTTNAVATELEKINTLTDNATNIVEVYVKAYQTGSGAVWGVWKRTLTVTKISGTVNIREINADVDKTSAGLTATSIAFNINGGDIDLDVTGIAATTIEWDSAYEIIL